ncbi:hypothetical protein FOIG_13653 [Fusarium odoratissimum NRRL 54006]|uniref:Tyrosinase C-terminal domain-containing protein n=1 Tax=Fusarium odoratissimum (strain NRRL 54006) TaxID=1089451 RepID=X0K881_FUSO5|nr:uncharacterized protein FOIG_13653 [Fusarium odoratissimum NRRL 54006]EXL93239.1 hypothetical protein FOIG_13653 [Fusarium odoratissimum NRRL 54006]
MITASNAGDPKPEETLRTQAKKFARITAINEPTTAITALSITKAVSSLDDRPKLVNIKAVKHALGGQYLIHIFLGPVPPKESTCLYAVSPNHVRTFSPLGQDTKTSCGKYKVNQAANMEVTGQVPLTIALTKRYFADELESLSEAHIIKYL